MRGWTKGMLRGRPTFAHATRQVWAHHVEACRTALSPLPFLPPRCCSRQSVSGAPRGRAHGCPLPAVTALSLAVDLDPPLVFVHSLQNNFDIPLANKSGKLFSPLNQ